MSKSKGNYYENSLVKEFQKRGLESWRVPLSGALGEVKDSKLPDRVRRLLVGDITVHIRDTDIPIEVKFRSTATGFSTLPEHFKAAQSEEVQLSIQRGGHTPHVVRRIDFLDCTLISGVDELVQYLSGISLSTNTSNTNLLNTTLSGWLDQVQVLALRSKRSKEWYFIVI